MSKKIQVRGFTTANLLLLESSFDQSAAAMREMRYEPATHTFVVQCGHKISERFKFFERSSARGVAKKVWVPWEKNALTHSLLSGKRVIIKVNRFS